MRGHNDVTRIILPLFLLGPRFDTPNPRAGLGGADIAVTAPFQPFGVSNQTRIPKAEIPNGAICSIAINGGDFRVEGAGGPLGSGRHFLSFFVLEC